MDRRSFLKTLVAGAGYALAVPSYSNLLVAPEIKALTIYDFGAGVTELVGTYPKLDAWMGLAFVASDNWFPHRAFVGTAFFFDPSPDQPVCKGHSAAEVLDLQGLYVYEGSEWLRLSASAR